jgi:hypothetical protein
MNNDTAVTITSRIADFREALQSGIEGIVRAAEIYVAALDADPRDADRFRDEFAEWVPAAAWSQFEAVGRKWMHPRLLMGGVSDRKKSAIIKKLPYSTQERVFKRERFQLLTASGEKLEVDILEATPEQAEQLCNGTSIRSLSEQRVWIESQVVKERAEEPEDSLPYTVTDGRVTFRRRCVLSRAELKRLLLEM